MKQIHPAAEIFPLLDGADFDALVQDIKEHGLREPIVEHEGAILDGRNRYRACQKAGVVPRFVQWDRDGTPEEYVVSKNLHRRHLNESQRAMIAARLAPAPAGLRTDLGQICPGSHTAEEAAKLLNVSRASVVSARKVLADGSDEEITAIEKGEAAVGTVAKQIRTGQSKEQRKKHRDTPQSMVGKNIMATTNMVEAVKAYNEA